MFALRGAETGDGLDIAGGLDTEGGLETEGVLSNPNLVCPGVKRPPKKGALLGAVGFAAAGVEGRGGASGGNAGNS